MARNSRSGVKTSGLRDLNRALDRIDKEFRKASVKRLRKIGDQVRATARGSAPFHTGTLRRSLRVSARMDGASIISSLSYAPVVEYGGTIAPRGTPFTIAPAHFINDAVVIHTSDIEDHLGDLLELIAHGNGFPLP